MEVHPQRRFAAHLSQRDQHGASGNGARTQKPASQVPILIATIVGANAQVPNGVRWSSVIGAWARPMQRVRSEASQ